MIDQETLDRLATEYAGNDDVMALLAAYNHSGELLTRAMLADQAARRYEDARSQQIRSLQSIALAQHLAIFHIQVLAIEAMRPTGAHIDYTWKRVLDKTNQATLAFAPGGQQTIEPLLQEVGPALAYLYQYAKLGGAGDVDVEAALRRMLALLEQFEQLHVLFDQAMVKRAFPLIDKESAERFRGSSLHERAQIFIQLCQVMTAAEHGGYQAESPPESPVDSPLNNG